MASLKPARMLLIAFSALAVLAAMWAGLIRMGWELPPVVPMLPVVHGPLMVCGFLGVLLGLERTAALIQPTNGSNPRIGWRYISPALTAIGSLALLAELPQWPGQLLITLGSLGLAVIFAVIVRRQPSLFTVTMALGAVSWFIGNSEWLAGQPIYAVVMWWVGFPLLTIVGERLELSRLMRLPRISQFLFVAGVGIFLAGAVWAGTDLESGVRLAAVGEIILALWLARYDIARRTVRKTGLPRYIALCLLLGYFWLAVGGIVGVLLGGIPAGPYYDALLHTLFLGFVVSMIFGHAPIILPSLLNVSVAYRPIFYTHLALLHLSLLVRITGDLAGLLTVRQWGGMLNVTALLMFLANTAYAVWSSRKSPVSLGKQPTTRANLEAR